MFSVIVPNWNGKRFLPNCINTLRNQMYRDFETIIVDDGSTDGSPEFIRRVSRSRLIALDKNHGFAQAVNQGIRAARGDTIILLNNDTEADSHWLEEIARASNRILKLGWWLATEAVR
jgi:GT2 family glycosyltransferase